ncbi:fatty acid 2-hydroxylase-like [Lethenteron reissneri]|uniref:fatty acid 2-hydroxylase-like n=1 Tax=Lethenteron reissneri TaxID=7753 RepID=UPI002AB6035E|nr:fatty acid 2-hydroxylase-like [Lethenteron reissneri]
MGVRSAFTASSATGGVWGYASEAPYPSLAGRRREGDCGLHLCASYAKRPLRSSLEPGASSASSDVPSLSPPLPVLQPAVTESNGVSSEQSGLEPDTSTDIEVTYKTVSTENDLVDWSKPLLWQVGHLREKYDEWVHQPVDRHIRLFGSDLVESWTKTSWYVVPSVWLPVVLLWSVWCNRELARGDTALHPPLLTSVSVTVGQEWFPFLFLLGMFIWSFVEYSLHRFLFHMTPPANNYYLITLHFLLHGQHHKSPFDGSRLVFPPLPASLFVALFYIGFRLALPSAVTGSLMVGGLAGYVIYDLTHYYLHYGAPRRGTYLYHLKAYHVKHHFEHQKLGFGITSKLWDFPFQTLIPKETFEKSH